MRSWKTPTDRLDPPFHSIPLQPRHSTPLRQAHAHALCITAMYVRFSQVIRHSASRIAGPFRAMGHRSNVVAHGKLTPREGRKSLRQNFHHHEARVTTNLHLVLGPSRYEDDPTRPK